MEDLSPAQLKAEKSSTLIRLTISLLVIQIVAVAVRFVSRYLSRAGCWWDDWTILAALVRECGALPKGKTSV